MSKCIKVNKKFTFLTNLKLFSNKLDFPCLIWKIIRIFKSLHPKVKKLIKLQIQ
jgi:hypothetical protein